jgi:hypothetical protein
VCVDHVCVCARAREREREREIVCERVCAAVLSCAVHGMPAENVFHQVAVS